MGLGGVGWDGVLVLELGGGWLGMGKGVHMAARGGRGIGNVE